MARLAVTVTVIFFLFASSHARTPLLFPETTANHRDLTGSDSDPTLLLPSEVQKKSDSEPEFAIDHVGSESGSEISGTRTIGTESQPSDSGSHLPESAAETVDLSKPLTIVRFRPVNRHFRDGRTYPIGFSHHNCRHRHRLHRRDERSDRAIGGGEIPYGNDMILSTGSNGFGGDAINGGGVRQIPAKWIRFHHHHRHHEGMPRFSYGRDDVFVSKRDYKKRPFHHHHDEGREVGRGGGGFMKRFRKFLNLFHF